MSLQLIVPLFLKELAGIFMLCIFPALNGCQCSYTWCTYIHKDISGYHSWCSVWSLSIFIFRFSRIQRTYNPQFSLKVGTLKEEEQISWMNNKNIIKCHMTSELNSIFWGTIEDSLNPGRIVDTVLQIQIATVMLQRTCKPLCNSSPAHFL